MSQIELSQISEMHTSPTGNEDNEGKKLPYPKAVFFIIATELSERFSYYGMRAVLTIYMRNMLKFSEDKATTLYHTFLLMCYGLPVFWGIIADSFLGKYKTIWIVSIFFAIGNVILTLSAIPTLQLPAIPLTIVGLLFMAFGTGGMKPCVAPFGGEQFSLPHQRKQLSQWFSVFFFAVTVGNMISTVITPVFRRDVQCFNMDTCYPLAFGVPAVIMLVAVVVFISGKSLYKINKPQGNMLVKVVRCITHALLNRKYSDEDKSHWLDHAEDKFDAGLIKDIKMLLRVLVYYIPIPIFFSLYEQLGSRWTLQATRMNGEIGNNFTIKPDQMQVSNAIFMFIFIPVFQTVIYPLFAKCKLLKRPLQRMGVGGILAALSFCVAGIVELEIEKNHYVPPSLLETHLKFVNTLPCSIILSRGQNNDSLTLNPDDAHIISVDDTLELNFNVVLTLKDSCSNSSIKSQTWNGKLQMIPGALQSVFIYSKNNSISAFTSDVKEDFKKSNEGNAKIRILVSELGHSLLSNDGGIFMLKSVSEKMSYDLTISQDTDDFSYTTSTEVPSGVYEISSNFLHNGTRIKQSGQIFNTSWQEIGQANLETGGNYLLVVHPDYENITNFKTQMIVISSPNKVHMLWLIPQYILMAWAEILFIVSGMEFSFTQAPTSMKSVLQSLWHFMNAIGNVIVIISATVQTKGHSQAIEFFEFSGAMLIDIIIFSLLAMRYTYVDITGSKLSKKDKNDNQNQRH